jgi:hypothetical protein
MGHTISFRLDNHYLAKLDAGAKKGESVHERARKVLMDALDTERQEEIKEELSELSEKMDTLHGDLALAVEALLITAGNYPKEKAKEWVNRNLRER